MHSLQRILRRTQTSSLAGAYLFQRRDRSLLTMTGRVKNRCTIDRRPQNHARSFIFHLTLPVLDWTRRFSLNTSQSWPAHAFLSHSKTSLWKWNKKIELSKLSSLIRLTDRSCQKKYQLSWSAPCKTRPLIHLIWPNHRLLEIRICYQILRSLEQKWQKDRWREDWWVRRMKVQSK